MDEEASASDLFHRAIPLVACPPFRLLKGPIFAVWLNISLFFNKMLTYPLHEHAHTKPTEAYPMFIMASLL